MTIPLPSLNLNFDKKTSNQNHNQNTNSIVLNIMSPRPRYHSESEEEEEDRKIKRKSSSIRRKSIAADVADLADDQPVRPYKSPDFSEVEKEFKDQLLSFTTDLLLCDVDLLKNISDFGNKVLFHERQLKQLIAILYLNQDDRKNFDELIEIETEKIVVHNCFCKDCHNPFYTKIKSIYVNKSCNFLSTPFAVSMTSTFKISLDHCLSDKKE